MRKVGLVAIVAGSIAAAGCATYPEYGYGYGPQGYNNGYYGNGYNNGYYGNGYNNGYYYDSQGRRIVTMCGASYFFFTFQKPGMRKTACRPFAFGSLPNR